MSPSYCQTPKQVLLRFCSPIPVSSTTTTIQGSPAALPFRGRSQVILTSTMDRNPQTKDLQVTFHLEPATGSLGAGAGRGTAHPTISPHLSGSESNLEMPGIVSSLKASEGLEKAGDTCRDAFKWRLCSRFPQKPALSCLKQMNKGRELSSEGNKDL